jgi:2-polyprenyl-3-methyl-5-hydroxy-6-metoxy-1,4-benzoquinol methylase
MSVSRPFRLHRRVPPWLLTRLADESELDHHARQNEQYFSEQVVENKDWWKRVGERFDFCNANVLDLGCGHGALSISIAESGASEVLGLDLEVERITFASEVIRQRYPELEGKLHFACGDIRALPQRHQYDYVVSKDSFEHIDGLQSVVDSIELLLKPGGKLIVGFSPLYYSPFGDHGRLGLPSAWLHAVLAEKWLLRWASAKQGRRIEKISDLGLNKLAPTEFRSLFPASRWRVISLKYNRGSRRLMPIMSALRKITPLEKYFTVNIYAVIEAIGAAPDTRYSPS